MRSLLAPRLFTVLLATPLLAQLPRSPEALPAAERAILTARMGPDPYAALGNWRRAPRDTELPDWFPEHGNEDAAWDWLMHTALWHADPDVARVAADQLDYHDLDLPAAERWLTVVWPDIFAANRAPEWDNVRRQASSMQVAELLADRDCWRADVRSFFLPDMHRCMRPEFAPRLAKLAQSDDPFLRRGAFGNLGTIAGYSDQYREVIGQALLALQPEDLDHPKEPFLRTRNSRYVPRACQLPVARPGWSPLLRAALERSFLELDKPLFMPFLMRWAEAETPAAEDRLLLAALLQTPGDANHLALRTMARIPAEPLLLRCLEHMPEAAPEALVLAARHDWPALRALAAEDETALAVALEFDFDATFLAWSAVAFGADAEAGLQAMTRLVEEHDTLAAPYRPNPKLVPRLRQAIELFGERLDFPRLHALVKHVHAARSTRLIELYWAKVTPQNLAESEAAVFEVTAEIDLLGRLQEWGASPDVAVRAPALELLLRLGDPKLDAAVLAHWQERHANDPLLLARCTQSTVVRTFLKESLQAAPFDADNKLPGRSCELLAAAAMADGLPRDVAVRWAADLAEDAETAKHFARYRELTLAGDWLQAVLAHYGSIPPRELSPYRLGQLADDGMKEILQKVRSTPGAAVPSAINELAMAGDWAAKEELDELRARHVYGWFDDADCLVQAGGRSLDLVPWLLEELETNCCRRNSAACGLDFLYGFEVHDLPENALRTQADRAREYWRACGEHLRWSVLADRFVVAGH